MGLLRRLRRDEVSVLDEAGKSFVVRLPGVKAFESNSFEPGVSAFGERAADTPLQPGDHAICIGATRPARVSLMS
jgi:hypothetical protein